VPFASAASQRHAAGTNRRAEGVIHLGGRYPDMKVEVIVVAVMAIILREYGNLRLHPATKSQSGIRFCALNSENQFIGINRERRQSPCPSLDRDAVAIPMWPRETQQCPRTSFTSFCIFLKKCFRAHFFFPGRGGAGKKLGSPGMKNCFFSGDGRRVLRPDMNCHRMLVISKAKGMRTARGHGHRRGRCPSLLTVPGIPVLCHWETRFAEPVLG